jgi:hypothetical protein
MEKQFTNMVGDCFKALAEKYGFNQETEINDGQTYSVEYGSDSFVIKLEKYRHEFYASLYKTGTSDMEVNLNNLLAYLHLDSSIVPVFEYCRDETDLEECYRKQLIHISTAIYNNYAILNEFFCTGTYALKVEAVRAFMLRKYPALFKRT